jgi:hypothetical protein
MEVGGLREGAVLLYAVGHQLLFGLAALGAGALAYVAHARGDGGVMRGLLWTSGLFVALTVRSMWKARTWSRRLRRRAPKG